MKMNDDLLGGLIPYIQLDSVKIGANAASTGCYFCALAGTGESIMMGPQQVEEGQIALSLADLDN